MLAGIRKPILLTPARTTAQADNTVEEGYFDIKYFWYAAAQMSLVYGMCRRDFKVMLWYV